MEMPRLRTSLLRLSVGMNERISGAQSRIDADWLLVARANVRDSVPYVAKLTPTCRLQPKGSGVPIRRRHQ